MSVQMFVLYGLAGWESGHPSESIAFPAQTASSSSFDEWSVKSTSIPRKDRFLDLSSRCPVHPAHSISTHLI